MKMPRLRRLVSPLRQLGRWFVHQPRALRFGLGFVLLLGLAVGGVYGRFYLTNRTATLEVAAGWRDFEDAARKTDLEAMQTALDRVIAAKPDEPNAPRYKAILDKGEADPDTPEVAVVLLVHHLRGDRLPEAAREAGKVLAKFPKDWLARCVVAHHALQVQHSPALAEQLLEQLADPEDPAARVNVTGVLYALKLSDAVDRDGSALRRVIVRRLAPLIRTAAAANASPAAKVQLLACYLDPFADAGSLGELSTYWAAADKLADDAVNEAVASGDAPALVKLANLGPRFRAALLALRDHDPARLPDDRLLPMLKAIEDRTRRAWQSARIRTPDQPEAYRGLALIALTGNDAAGAVQQLLDGLAVCNDQPILLELLIAIVGQAGTDDAVRALADTVWKSAVDAKTDPIRWCLAAQIAFALNRADAALAACQEARAIQPNHPWACLTEARLRVRAEQYLAASEALAPLGEAALLTNPAVTRLRGRILIGSGLWVIRAEEFQKILDAQAKSRVKTAAPAVGYLLGILEAPPNAERAAWVAAQAELLLSTYPDTPVAAQLRAEALFRLAELSAISNPQSPSLPPLWTADRVAAALRGFAKLPTEEQADPSVIAAIALLQLKGQQNAAAALRTCAALLASEAKEANLGGRQLEILGAVLEANGKPAEAVRVLERAMRFPNFQASASGRVSLALAYRKNNQPLDARAALAAAEQITDRSDREQAELIAAKLLFQRENP